MMSVYQWFQNRAELAFQEAQSAPNVRQKSMYKSDYDKWQERAGVLTVEEAQRPWDAQPLWGIIQECDKRLKEPPTPKRQWQADYREALKSLDVPIGG